MDQRADATPIGRSEGSTKGMSAPYLYTLAFFSGMCIMAIELCASRLMAPFFGTSTFVWTNVIGVIMIALSIGYLVGGRLADRNPRPGILLWLLLAACGFLLALPFFGPFLLRGLASGMQSYQSAFTFIFFGSLFSVVLLFALPITILAMTSPFLIRLLAQERRVGDSAGRVFALSTVGSVLGTFLPILVFIPVMGTSKTILCFAAALLVVVALGFTRRRNAVLCLVLAIPLLLRPPALHRTPGLVHETESAYQYIEVFDRGPMRYLAYNDALGYQTVASKTGPLTGVYYDYYALLPLFTSAPPRSTLILGLGGGIIANQYRFFHPEIEVEGVEIDPKVIQVARSYFALTNRTRVFNQDARVFVQRRHSLHDLIIVDAYAQQIYIPFHLTTSEFFREVRAGLAAGGIVAMNVSAARDDSPVLVGITQTLRRVFGHVYSLRIPDSFDNVVLASDQPLDFAVPEPVGGTPLQPLAEQCNHLFREHPADPSVRPFTDDWAPIEHMVDWQMVQQNRW